MATTNFNNMNQSTNRSFHTEKPYMDKDTELRQLIRTTELGFCADALMLFNPKAPGESAIRQENFLQFVEKLCQEERGIWTSMATIRELERIKDSGFAEKRQAAEYALSFLRRLNDSGRLRVYNDTDSMIEICRRRTAQTRTPLSVITQSAALAEQIEAFNKNGSAAPITVRRVNMGGKISAFLPGNQISGSGTDMHRPQSASDDSRRGAMSGAPTAAPVVKEQRAFSALVLSAASIRLRPISAPASGATVYGRRSSRSYRLGKYVGSGGEANVYMVEGDNSRVIKVYKSHVSDALEHKIELLSGVRVRGCAMPEEAVYNQAGVFCGYVMPRISGVPLTQTFDSNWRKARMDNFLIEQQFNWNRADFIRASLRVLEIERELMKKGIYITDVRLENVMVGFDIDDHLSPDHLCLIDIDSAQVDTALLSGGRERGFLAGGGVTESFVAPEVTLPFTTSTLLDVKTLAYQFCMQTFVVMMAGVHPFAAQRDITVTADRSLRGACQKGEFPYRISGYNSSCGLKAPQQSSYLFSYLPNTLKALMHETFSCDGKYFSFNKRAGLMDELLEQMRYADQWFRDVRNVRKFEEMLSLTPSEFKPFKHQCDNPTCSCADRNLWRKVVNSPEKLTKDTVLKVNDEYLCKECYEKKYGNKSDDPMRMIQDGLAALGRGFRSFFNNI